MRAAARSSLLILLLASACAGPGDGIGVTPDPPATQPRPSPQPVERHETAGPAAETSVVVVVLEGERHEWRGNRVSCRGGFGPITARSLGADPGFRTTLEPEDWHDEPEAHEGSWFVIRFQHGDEWIAGNDASGMVADELSEASGVHEWSLEPMSSAYRAVGSATFVNTTHYYEVRDAAGLRFGDPSPPEALLTVPATFEIVCVR